MKSRFIKSAVKVEDCPEGNVPEVAIAGRSNVGKSSSINSLLGAKLAKVSREPGKTRLLNFFDLNGKFRLVDMPGYGYAARSEKERLEWKSMVENYLQNRPNLVGMIVLVDIRRDWQMEEGQIVDWCQYFGIPVVIGVTKSDKLGRQEALKRLDYFKKKTGLEVVFLLSSLKRIGYQALEEYIFMNWVKGKL